MECCGRHVGRLKVILLFIFCALATCTTAEAKGAVITLHAKWQNAPLLLEAVEFLVSTRRPQQCTTPSLITAHKHQCGSGKTDLS